MKFNFKIQQYQTDAVDSVVNCFNGQPYIDNVSYRRDIGNVRQMKDMSQIEDGKKYLVPQYISFRVQRSR